MPNTPPQLLADSTILTCRFVTMSGTDERVDEANANEMCLGISQEGSRTAPLSDLVATNQAAQQGETLRLFGPGDVCLLTLGDTVTRGLRLKADNAGRGVPVTLIGTTIQEYGAIALQSGVVNEKIKVLVDFGRFRPT